MGLLSRRKNRPSPSTRPPPGDWMDALQAAMWVDPAVRPKWDRRPGDPDEVTRLINVRAAAVDAGRDDADDLRPRAIDYGPIRLADDPEPVPVIRPPSAEKPWLIPTPSPDATALPPPPADVSAAGPAVAAPVAVELLFQWVCRLSRLRRAGPSAPADAFAVDRVRTDAERYLTAVGSAGASGARLRSALTSFVDTVMVRGGLPLTGGPWQPLGPTPPEAAYLSAASTAVDDPTGQHDGTWAVHHAALSLIADLVPGGPDVLSTLDAKLRPPPSVEPGADAHICPSAYEGVFDHAIVRPVGRPVRAVAAAAVGLLLLAVAGAVLLNVRYAAQLRGSIDAVDRALRTGTMSVGERR